MKLFKEFLEQSALNEGKLPTGHVKAVFQNVYLANEEVDEDGEKYDDDGFDTLEDVKAMAKQLKSAGITMTLPFAEIVGQSSEYDVTLIGPYDKVRAKVDELVKRWLWPVEDTPVIYTTEN